MRYFEYIEPNIEDETYYVVASEQDILTSSWAEQCREMNVKHNKMNLKYGFELVFLSNQDIIDDFICVNWAYEVIGEA